MCSGPAAGSYLRLIDSCITQLKAQGPSRTRNVCKEEEEKEEEEEEEDSREAVVCLTHASDRRGQKKSRAST